MTGFSRESKSGLVLWRGAPSDAAHAYLLALLEKDHAASFISASAEMNDRIKGNLGEFLCFRLGVEDDFQDLQLLPPPNAFQPLSRISRAGLDLVWVHFADDPDDDFAVLQEVKVTGDTGLAYASDLPKDYEKMFGTDANLTLHTRLVAAKNEVEFVLGRPDLVPRVTTLAGTSPATSPKVRLVPTLVHDDAAASREGVLRTVRESIIGAGWQDAQVRAWSVAVDSLNSRFERLAMGKP